MSEVIDTIPQYKLKNPWAKDVFVLLQCGVPIGIAPTGTMAANGAVTLGTALNATYSGGLWLYFPSGAVYSGSAAGFYWTVMSSTTLGTVYDNIYVPGTNSYDIPASPTAISAAGPGAYTGVTSEITLVSSTLPGGLLGNHGSMIVSYKDARANTAGTKTAKFKLGGTTCLISNTAASFASFSSVNTSRNAGRQDRQQVIDGAPDSSSGSANVATYRTIDTSISQTILMTQQLSAATDYVIMFGFMVEVIPS